MLIQPEFMLLHKEMWGRQARAITRTSPAVQHQAAEIRAFAGKVLPELRAQPPFVGGARLHPHQLAGVNWLRAMWAGGRNTVLADDAGLGKTATAVAFLACLLQEFRVAAPLLVVAPAAVLDQWAWEWEFWAQPPRAGGVEGLGARPPQPPPPNVVVYSGSTAARTILHDYELWFSPASMDSKMNVGVGLGP